LATIKLIREDEATGKVKEIYQEIKSAMGWTFVPETFQVIAHNPDHLEAYWHHYKAAMGPGRIDLKTKKIIAFVVSAMNNCSL